VHNEKEMQALVKRLSKASAKKALEKEAAAAVIAGVGRAQEASSDNTGVAT